MSTPTLEASEPEDDTFATLTPFNERAIRVASTLWSDILDNQTKYRHQLQFISCQPEPVPLHKLLNQRAESPRLELPVSSLSTPTSPSELSSDATVADSENDSGNDLVWQLEYLFSLNHELLFPRLGWLVGYGKKWEERPERQGDVDIMIAVDATRQSNIRSPHARFSFHPESGQFALRATRSASRGTLSSVSIGHQRLDASLRLLLGDDRLIAFGDLLYKFTYHVLPEDEREFQLSKKTYMVTKLHVPLPNDLTSVTPSQYDVRFGDWTLMRTAGAGSEAIIKAAVSKSGHRAAVRQCICRSKSDRNRVSALIRNLKTLKDRFDKDKPAGAEYVHHLLEVFTTSDQDTFYILTAPLAFYDFHDNLFRLLPLEMRFILYAQTIAGVAALHHIGFMHNDLKPSNLVVVSTDPPKAAIIDFGTSADISHRRNLGMMSSPGHDGGTVGYHSPERESISPGRYGLPADVWALGIVGLQVLRQNHAAPFPYSVRFNPFRDTSTFSMDRAPDPREQQRVRALGEAVIQLLSMEPPQSLEHLLSRMLIADPEERIAAAEAQLHGWVQERLAAPLVESRTGDRRRRESRNDDPAPQRVRRRTNDG